MSNKSNIFADVVQPAERPLIDALSKTVLCPKCGGDYTHIHRVFTREGSDPVEGPGAYSGTQVDGKVEERRRCLVIEFECEEDHVFEWRIQQHKGQNYVAAATWEQMIGEHGA